MNAVFAQLLDTVSRNGSDLGSACGVIGTLIELERTNWCPNDGGLRESLGNEYSRITLSADDIRVAVDVLIGHIEANHPPSTSAVWALAKSRELRAVPVLIRVLEAAVAAPEQYYLALNALHGIEDIGIGSPMHQESLAAIRNAAAHGSDEIRCDATDYLEHYATGQGSD